MLLAALGPVMLRIAGERTDGTVLWMADERAIAEHVVPRITKAAEGAGRPAPRVVAGVAVACVPTTRWTRRANAANRMLGHAEYSPNYQRLLEQGDATDVGDIAALGSEADVERRLRSYADAGTTDLSVGSCPWATGARSSSPPPAGRASSWRRSRPNSHERSDRARARSGRRSAMAADAGCPLR